MGIVFNCKKCGAKKVLGELVVERQSIRFGFIPLYAKNYIFAICSLCQKKNLTSLSHSELNKYSENTVLGDKVLLSPVSLTGKLFVILALIFSLFPIMGVLLSLGAFLATNRYRNIYRQLTFCALLISLIASTAFLVYMSLK